MSKYIYKQAHKPRGEESKRMHRSKVTVSARPLVSNQTEEKHQRHHADLSFYFAVVRSIQKANKPRETMMVIVKVDPGGTLEDYDLTPPTCSLLCLDQCQPGDCQGWTARVRVPSTVYPCTCLPEICSFLYGYI